MVNLSENNIAIIIEILDIIDEDWNEQPNGFSIITMNIANQYALNLLLMSNVETFEATQKINVGLTMHSRWILA